MPGVSQMLKNMLDATEAKLAHETRAPGSEATKTAAAKEQPKEALTDPIKVANACFFLAENLGQLVDDRTDSEKLAEYIAFSAAMHKTASAEASSIPPMRPPISSNGELKTNEASATTDEPPLKGNDSGKAHAQIPTTTSPTERGAGDRVSNTAMGTNANDAPGAGAKLPEKIASNVTKLLESGAINVKQASFLLRKNGGSIQDRLARRAFEDQVKIAMAGGLNEKLAKELVTFQLTEAAARGKEASAVDNPPNIQGSTTPILQTAKDANPAQSQGRVSGESVQEELKGSDPGRDLIRNEQAAINATQRETKAGPKAELKKYLNEPALSSSTDNVLDKALDNASSAGVKIANGLKKWASTSPENSALFRQALEQVRTKQANQFEGAPQGGTGEMPPDPAMLAAQQGMQPGAETGGMTPEELAQAEALLAQLQGAGGAPPGMMPGMPMGGMDQPQGQQF